MKKLLIICGQEGSGKSTLAKKIVPHINNGAAFDTENIAQVYPFEFNNNFQNLIIDNTLDLIHNFYEYGYERVVAGSFILDRGWFDIFRLKLKYDPTIYIVMLGATKSQRDMRRLTREKKSTKEMMDWMDNKYPADTTLKDSQKTGNYTYIEIDNSNIPVEESIIKIKELIPDFFS